MASVIGITSIPLAKDEMKALVAGVTRGIASACGFDEEKVSMMILPPLPEGNYGPSMVDRITYLVFTHTKTREEKERIQKNIYEATVAVTGNRGPYRVITFFKEHQFNECGFDDWVGADE